MHVVIHTDGGSRGNPGKAASAFTVHNSEERVLHEESKFLGVATNNVAEYTALRMAAEWLSLNFKTHEIASVEVVMDSELVVKQMKGEYKIKDANLRLIAIEVKRLESLLPFKLAFMHVFRSKNTRADELVNMELDRA